MTTALLVLLLGLALAGTAASVGVAAAAVSQHDLTRWVAYKLRGAGLGAARLLDDPGRVLATANALTTIGVIVAAAALPAVLAGHSLLFLGLFTLAVAAPLFVGAAYLAPRVVGRRWAEPIVAWALPWVDRAGRLLAPAIPTHTPTARTALAAVLSSGVDTDAIAWADEIQVVSGVLAFSDRPVRELMTPRTTIVAIPEGMLAGEAAHVFTQSGHNRYPVYRRSLDEVVGVAHTIDLLFLQPDEAVRGHAALSVPATTRSADLMLQMQRGGGHLAVVLDEFGGTAGLVTLGDLLNELVKEVFGRPAGTAAEVAPPLLLELEGNTPASRVEEAFGVSLAVAGGRGVTTVAGLLIQALGRIPRPGERFLYRGLEFDVLGASATRVERVVVRLGPARPLALERPEERV
ncbi:MAG: transporter associated domain-containing protein [Gemmatimonadales bacterium]